MHPPPPAGAHGAFGGDADLSPPAGRCSVFGLDLVHPEDGALVIVAPCNRRLGRSFRDPLREPEEEPDLDVLESVQALPPLTTPLTLPSHSPHTEVLPAVRAHGCVATAMAMATRPMLGPPRRRRCSSERASGPSSSSTPTLRRWCSLLARPGRCAPWVGGVGGVGVLQGVMAVGGVGGVRVASTG